MTDSLFKNSFIYYHTGIFPLLQDVKLFSLFCMFSLKICHLTVQKHGHTSEMFLHAPQSF